MANKNTKQVNNARKKFYAHNPHNKVSFAYLRPSRQYVALNRGIKPGSGIQPGSFVTVQE